MPHPINNSLLAVEFEVLNTARENRVSRNEQFGTRYYGQHMVYLL
jgi:hypothetical protein